MPPLHPSRTQRPALHALLVAHSCSPSGGSEARMTWQWITHLAQEGIRVTALVNRSDPTSPIDPRTASLPDGIDPGLEPRFVAVEPPVLSRRLPVVVYTALDYQLWQRRALHSAQKLHAVDPFDLVHHLSWASIHHGSRLNDLGPPFVLGPVGGGTRAASGYRDCFPNSWRYEQIRNGVVRATPFSPMARRLVGSARLVLASNPETQSVLKALGASDVQVMLDDGVDPQELSDHPVPQSATGPLRVLWVSRVMERKALGMALSAVERAAEKVPICVTVMGDGPHRQLVDEQMDSMVAAGTAVDRGWTEQEELATAYSTHEVLLFNSVRDNGSAPLHAASAYGLPAVVLDHQGPGTITEDTWAIKIPPSTTEQSIADIADALVQLAGDVALRERMAKAALSAGQANTWPQRAKKMASFYREIVAEPA